MLYLLHNIELLSQVIWDDDDELKESKRGQLNLTSI